MGQSFTEIAAVDWKTTEHEYARDFAQRMDAITPEPLYESTLLPSPKVCLVCASERAESGLYSGTRLIVPLCTGCSADWNFHRYDLLKRVRPKELLARLAKYKLLHLFSRPGPIELYKDVSELGRWAKKMKTIMSGVDRAEARGSQGSREAP
jgi:hypothetical protein